MQCLERPLNDPGKGGLALARGLRNWGLALREKHGLWPANIIWEFPQIRGVPYFGVLIIRILLFRLQHQGLLFSETPEKESQSLGFAQGLGF